MKALSLKLKDEVFAEVEAIIKEIKQPRNTYINEALSLYTQYKRRKLLRARLKAESLSTRASSLEVLREMESLDDFLP
jgi:predicted transcriptional regulator